jgi:hypothetical protein
MTYATTMDPTGTQAVTLIDNGLGQGMQVPCVIGNSAGAYTHYVLAMTRRAAVAGGGHDYQFHNTWDGGTSWQTGAQITSQTMTLALGTVITSVEVPTPTPSPVAATPSPAAAADAVPRGRRRCGWNAMTSGGRSDGVSPSPASS